MQFIKLKKIECQGKFWVVNTASIASVEVCDEESTWVELTTGSKCLVSDFADDILKAIEAQLIECEES